MLKNTKGRELLHSMSSKQRISQASMSSNLGVAVNSIRQWISGICRPSPVVRDRIERYYGVPASFWDEEIPLSFEAMEAPAEEENTEETQRKLQEMPLDVVLGLRSLGLRSSEIVAVHELYVPSPHNDEECDSPEEIG